MKKYKFEKNPFKPGKLMLVELTKKEKTAEFFKSAGLSILRVISFPFYILWSRLKWLYHNILWDRIYTGDNGIYGPGYTTYHTTKFSWGKLSFVLVVLFIITFLIFLR